jgi:hypothetical protein
MIPLKLLRTDPGKTKRGVIMYPCLARDLNPQSDLLKGETKGRKREDSREKSSISGWQGRKRGQSGWVMGLEYGEER